MAVHDSVDHLFRERAGQMVATLTRIFGPGNLDLVEEVVQDAFVKAMRQWPYHGEPENPSAWIIQVAKNRALDLLRRRSTWDGKRGEIEHSLGALAAPGAADAAVFSRELDDDRLRMMFTCCSPALGRDLQVALTLKTVGGFSVSEIGRAFLAKKSTIAQRLVRAKRKLREENVAFRMPDPDELPERLEAVLEVLYLMFNEGYGALEGDDLVRTDLCAQAIGLCHLLAEHPVTDRPEVHALAALLDLQGARLPARADAAGELLLLEEQDRTLWDTGLLRAGLDHFERSAAGETLSRYHLEAEIAACHSLAPSYAATDWRSILACYDALLELSPSPVVAVNRIVALYKVNGAERALRELSSVEDRSELQGYYPLFATRGVLQEANGRDQDAAESFKKALELTECEPVRRFLHKKLRGLVRIVPGRF